mgnify:CR=1 FL=1
MAGYNYAYGMSNNALDAYEEGIKPISQITAEDLRRVCWRGTKADAIRLAMFFVCFKTYYDAT